MYSLTGVLAWIYRPLVLPAERELAEARRLMREEGEKK
jgi:hypothetical protein